MTIDNEWTREIEKLKEWKRDQLEVESSWNPQEVARELGVPLGMPIRMNILPIVKTLKAELSRLTAMLTEARNVLMYIVAELDECKNCHAPARMVIKAIGETNK